MKRIIIGIIIFLLIGSFMIKTKYDLNLKEKTDKKIFVTKMVNWSLSIVKNIVEITGLIIKQTWVPEYEEENQNQTYT